MILGGDESTERLKSGAKLAYCKWQVLGAPRSSPHRMLGLINPAHAPYTTHQISSKINAT